ncbi:MAG: hypothetical protein ACE5E1_01045 [Phycisphaerae bacterium]
MRPSRRPPPDCPRPVNGPVLRIGHGPAAGDAETGLTQTYDWAEAGEEIRRIAAELRAALPAIESVQRHLERTADLLRLSDVEEPPTDEAISARQAAMDRRLLAIDEIARTAEHDGCSLLDGTWAATLADAEVAGVRVLRIPSVACRALGHERIGGMLCSLATGGASAPQHGGVARGLAIIRCAMLQVAGIKEQAAAFLRDAVEPLLHRIEVTVENLEAAREAVVDLDLARGASQLTRLDVLLAGAAPSPKPSIEKSVPRTSATTDHASRPVRLIISPEARQE